jgi:hypothetical protein
MAGLATKHDGLVIQRALFVAPPQPVLDLGEHPERAHRLTVDAGLGTQADRRPEKPSGIINSPLAKCESCLFS